MQHIIILVIYWEPDIECQNIQNIAKAKPNAVKSANTSNKHMFINKQWFIILILIYSHDKGAFNRSHRKSIESSDWRSASYWLSAHKTEVVWALTRIFSMRTASGIDSKKTWLSSTRIAYFPFCILKMVSLRFPLKMTIYFFSEFVKEKATMLKFSLSIVKWASISSMVCRRKRYSLLRKAINPLT